MSVCYTAQDSKWIHPCWWLHHLGGTVEKGRRAKRSDTWKRSKLWRNCRNHLFDIAARLGTGLDEHDVQLFGSLLSLLNHNLPAGKSRRSALFCWPIQHRHANTQLRLKGASRHRLRCEHRLMTRSPLLLQVGFVPDEHDDDVTSSLRPDIVDPFAGLLEWVHICGEQTPFTPNSLLLDFQMKK